MVRVTIVGTGFVGISNALLLSRNNEVVCLDISKERVDLINDKHLTVKDDFAERFWNEHDLDIRATIEKADAYNGSDFVIIATPTNYDTESGYFDTSSVESSIVDANPAISYCSSARTIWVCIQETRYHKWIFSSDS
jgi:UDPglucose 6-dehydrogenase